MGEQSAESIERRLDRLEHSIRRWQIAAGLAGAAALLVLVAMGAAALAPTARAAGSGAKDLVVGSLTLVDQAGRTRGELAMVKDMPMLRLFDQAGKSRALLYADKDGTALGLFDQAGKLRASLSVFKDGPALELFDQKGADRVAIGNTGLETPKTDATENTGPSSVVLFDTKGKVLWRAP